jgi:AraC-like DNA-binding protein
MELDKGDNVLLAHGNSHRIYVSLMAPTISMEELYRPCRETTGTVQQRSITNIIHGHFDVPANGNNPYRASLPAIVKLNIGENALMRSSIPMLDALHCEHESTEIGRQVVINQIVKLLLVQTIRGYALKSSQTQQFESQSAANWLRGTLDPAIGPVLSLIHARPADPWTVRGLAKQINMSKSSFSEKFRDVVGRPPLQYLTEYRIHKACQMLHETKLGVKEIASQVGYESASSFSNAFKRWTGMAPAAYRKVS